MVKKKKGFTLIELIAVLVIMAILALIVTPLVMNIIRHARVAADKRSIDAYGRSIELAIAGYLLDNGKFPAEISQLTIEYSGDTVTCKTTQINPDSSIYLAGCTVKNRTVEGYAYGTDKSPSYTAYSIGDYISYNGVTYYVIEDSGIKKDTVKLIIENPLNVAEINQYGGVETNNNHVNVGTESPKGTAKDINGYGGMAYYSSSTCGGASYPYTYTGCTTNYAQSEIKYAVDAWKSAKAPAAEEARLITRDEYIALTVTETYETPTEPGTRYVPQYDWLYNSNYNYWTMSQWNDSPSSVWRVDINGDLNTSDVFGKNIVVRPVIVLDKSLLTTE